MLVTIPQPALLQALTPIRRVAEKRSSRPALANLHMTAGEGRLVLRGSNGELERSETLAAQIEKDGVAVFAAHTFHEIVNRLAAGAEVKLDADRDPNHIHISAGRSQFRLPRLAAEEFPPPLDSGGVHNHFEFRMAAATLKHTLDTARIAVSTDESRFYLNGVHLHSGKGAEGEDDALFAVATDGHRLARIRLALPAGVESVPGIIVPNRAVAEIARLHAEQDDEASIRIDEGFLRVTLNGGGGDGGGGDGRESVLTSRLIEGAFPDYQRVIPTDNPFRARFDTALLTATLKRVEAICSETRPIYPLKLDIDGKRLILSVDTGGEGEASEEIAVDYEGDPLTIGFNIRYFMEIVEHMNGETAEITLKDPNAPIFMHAPEHPNICYVLMPMRLS